MPVKTIQLRHAKTEDLEQLNELMYQLHDEHHQAQPEHFKTAEEIEQEKSIARYLDSPECLVYVACEGELIVGFVSGHFCELTSSVSKPVQMGSIDELYVLPKARQQGIAKELLKFIESTFRDYGVKQTFVEVWDFNQAAIRLYQNSGFGHHIHWLRKPLTE
ncbi:GNAT family N-acetyltransferase [Vibrio sp. T187]|nr:GNAT family N-acetyltransferase [Vibrio sp. T187]